jgi:flagellar biosynthesis protein FlhB
MPSPIQIHGFYSSKFIFEFPLSFYLVLLVKVLFAVITYKIGTSALRTFKPIVADIKKEETEGIISSEKKSNSIKLHLKISKKLILVGFVLLVVAFFGVKHFFTNISKQVIDSMYENEFIIDERSPIVQFHKTDDYSKIPFFDHH